MEYTYQPSRNPFRIARAAWRAMRDLTSSEDVLIVEMAFARSRRMRRFARWEQTAAELARDPLIAERLRVRPRLLPIDVEALGRLPEGTLGRSYAGHLKACGLDPHITEPPPVENDGDYLLAHIIETHDVWHVVTGFGTDLSGEFALVSFYGAQTGITLAALLLALGFFNTAIFAPGEFQDRLAALSAGWNAGRSARPLIGIDWRDHWERPLEEVRASLGLTGVSLVGKGLRIAA